MSGRGTEVAVRVLAIVAVCTVGFAVLERPLRHAETVAATNVLHRLGADRAHMVLPTSIQVFPASGDAFRAVITPACSSAGSLLAIAALAAVAPLRPSRGRRRAAAMLAAVAAVAAGNVVRIVASIGVGFVAGRSSLVLFHDWVGSVFTFVYTLGGFVLFLFLLLPARTPDPSELDVAVRA